MSALRLLPWALLLMSFVFAFATRSDLAMSTIALATHVGFTIITALLPSKPELFNFPEKEQVMKLPASYRAPVIVVMQQTMDLASALTIAYLCGAQVMLWHKARTGTEGAFSIALIVTGIFIGPAILLLATRVTTATEEAMRKWKAAGSPTA